MTVRRRTLVAVATAGILGLVAGVVVAYLSPTEAPRRRPSSDPLHLGVPLVNQPCSGQDLLVVAWGDTHVALANGVQDNPGARYLRTAQSCPTWWDHAHEPTPAYTAYLGPYDTSTARACQQRMTGPHKGDVVTRLDQGATQFVVCACELKLSAAPTLSPGMPADATRGIWVRAVQDILLELGLNKSGDLHGRYDLTTQAAVKHLQSISALAVTGTVDEDTWRSLRTRACGKYDY